ncbi:MAG: 3-oxoacyl-ACP synthase, partial [Amphiplicatus sp.]|nr:3-oxoacyl-ACP synthase [Amphiplicatus sp.]
RMQGNKVFREAVTRISEAMETVARQAGVAPTDIDWFVPHQANERIIQGVVRKLDLRPDQVISTISGQGNTSAASIPLAYCQGVADGRIKKGDLVMLEAMGGGITWGAALLRA